jgi:zinc protease
LTRASPDFPAVAFFTDYLGLHRQSSGRLFQELREKRGLNYGDYAYAEYFEQDGSSRFPRPNLARRQQLLSIWLRPVKPENALFAIHAALREYDGALARPIPEAEIVRYRTFLTRYTALEELTPSRRLGDALDDLAYGVAGPPGLIPASGGPYLDTMRDGWKALDEASLAAAAGRHLGTDGIAIAIIAKDGAALAEALVAGSAVLPPVYESPKPKAVTDADAEIVRFPVPVKKDNVRVVFYGDLFKE